MNREHRVLVFGALGLVVSAIASYLALASVDLGSVARTISNADPLLLALAVLVLAVQTTVRTGRWRALLASLPGVHPVPLTRLLPVTLIGYLGNASLPARLGEPIRAVLVARREGLSPTGTFGTVVLERMLDTLVLAALGLVAATAVGAPGWVLSIGLTAAALAALALLIVTAAAHVLGGPGLGRLRMLHVVRAFPSRFAILRRPFEAAVTIIKGAGVADRPGTVIAAAALSLIAWLLDAALFLLVARALGIDLSPLAAVVITAVGALSTAIPSAPGYVGTFELAVAGAGQVLGLDPTQALALALVVHAVALVPMVLAGGLAFMWVGREARVPLRSLLSPSASGSQG